MLRSDVEILSKHRTCCWKQISCFAHITTDHFPAFANACNTFINRTVTYIGKHCWA